MVSYFVTMSKLEKCKECGKEDQWLNIDGLCKKCFDQEINNIVASIDTVVAPLSEEITIDGKVAKSGESYYFTIPIRLIREGIIKKDKKYRIHPMELL